MNTERRQRQLPTPSSLTTTAPVAACGQVVVRQAAGLAAAMTRATTPAAAAPEEDPTLPLVLAVNCLTDCDDFKLLTGVACFRSIAAPSAGRPSSPSPSSPRAAAPGAPLDSRNTPFGSVETLMEECTVLILNTLQDLPPALQQRAFMPALVILLSTTAASPAEAYAAEQMGVQRLLQVRRLADQPSPQYVSAGNTFTSQSVAAPVLSSTPLTEK